MSVFLYLFVILFVMVFLWIYPIISTLRSPRIHGMKKLIWTAFVVMFSWPVYILFLLVA